VANKNKDWLRTLSSSWSANVEFSFGFYLHLFSGPRESKKKAQLHLVSFLAKYWICEDDWNQKMSSLIFEDEI